MTSQLPVSLATAKLAGAISPGLASTRLEKFDGLVVVLTHASVAPAFRSFEPFSVGSQRSPDAASMGLLSL
ncbi:hypothetical protein ACFC0S_14925 [Streptomyces sp. NPDC056084]|uniref:hypothetical protein n=1 Tax=unclassified Streptomyces TaxID=2593676 RepID=UPI0035DECD0C